MKKGRFTQDESVFIKQNYLQMSDKQIAEILDRDKGAIANFRRRHSLDKKGMPSVAKNLNSEQAREDFIQALPEESKKKELLANLRSTSQYSIISKTLDKPEILFYEDRFIDFMMDPTIETMTSTERDALHRKTLAEIRMHRFMEEEKEFREKGMPQNKAREIKDLNDQIFQCEKSLNVTREQRLKDGQDQSITFTNIIKELSNPISRQRAGCEAVMLKWMQEASFNDAMGEKISAGDQSQYDLSKNFVNPDDHSRFSSDFLKEEDDEEE